MIKPREIINTVLAEPFRPFRVNMVSGKSYEIKHPEVAGVGKTALTIFTPMLEDDLDDDVVTVGDGLWIKVSYLMIESVEPLQRTTASVQQ